jgi:hypothetical protein
MDFAYGLNSSMWDTYDNAEWDPRHRVGFIGDDQYNYDASPLVDAKMEDEEEPSASERDLFFGVDISGEEIQDDTNDYLGFPAYSAEKAKEEGMEEQLPYIWPEPAEEEAFGLAVKTCKLHEAAEC